MNKLTREILTLLLSKGRNYVDLKTGKLKRNVLLNDYENIREAKFYDEVYFPKLQKVTNSLRNKPKLFGEYEWELHEVGYEKSISVWYPVDLNLQDWLGNLMQKLTEDIWYGDEWAWENPSEEEIFQLGIVPDNMQLKLL